jgi:hypothetical protein
MRHSCPILADSEDVNKCTSSAAETHSMLHRLPCGYLSSLILYTLTASALFAQNTVPDDVLYRELFHRVVAREQAAADIESRGQSGTRIRSSLQNDLQLMSSEYTALVSAAKEYNSTRTSLGARVNALLPKPSPSGPSSAPVLDGPTQDQLRQLESQLSAAFTKQLTTLKTTLGPARFAVLDKNVRSVIGPTIHSVPARTSR